MWGLIPGILTLVDGRTMTRRQSVPLLKRERATEAGLMAFHHHAALVSSNNERAEDQIRLLVHQAGALLQELHDIHNRTWRPWIPYSLPLIFLFHLDMFVLVVCLRLFSMPSRRAQRGSIMSQICSRTSMGPIWTVDFHSGL